MKEEIVFALSVAAVIKFVSKSNIAVTNIIGGQT